MRKIAALLLAVLLIFTLASCRQSPAAAVASIAQDSTASRSPDVSGTPYSCKIGVSLPDKSILRWERDGADIKKQLEAKGCTVELMFAHNDVATQMSQLKELVAKGCKVLVIAAIDSGALDAVLADAKAVGVTVIAYDRLIMNTINVDYYVSFDAFRYGAAQGEYIEKALDLKEGKGPFNIELFTGSLDDGNVMLYYKGAMDVLSPYIESGRLVVKSGQIDMMDVGIMGWKSERAKTRMDDLLARYYTGDKLDAVLSPNDSIALGIIASLEDAGYTKFPLITGMDCDKPNVIAMRAGKQSMSVLRDTHILAVKVVEMVDAILSGKEVPVNDTKTYKNGVKFVPTFLCDPAVVTVDNIQEILIDGGYYTKADLGM